MTSTVFYIHFLSIGIPTLKIRSSTEFISVWSKNLAEVGIKRMFHLILNDIVAVK
jgi:hypothetical protein